MIFHLHTYGCQMNQRDSEALAEQLIKAGYQRSITGESADIVIVNSCSVRGKAEDKALGKLAMLAANRRSTGSPVYLGVVGCMVQRMQKQLFDRVPALDFAVGPQRIHRLPAILDQVIAGQGPVLDVSLSDNPEVLTGHQSGTISAFVTILLGCNRRCAYCIVPTVRGPEWSRPASGILEEIRILSAAGVREVTLLGQSVMSYGRSNPVWSGTDQSPLGFTEPLPRLLEAVCGIPSIVRLRFTSGHPSGCTEELARVMGACAPLCEHLHLPVQSGSDAVLHRMRRGYSSDDYRRAVERLRRFVPALSLTTDVIVGFPGETNDDFEQTRSFLDEIGFDNAFIFKYSPRPGTPAASWEDDVPETEKNRRNQVLLEDQDRRGLQRHQNRIGCDMEILVEGPSLRDPTRWAGRTRSNIVTIFDPRPGLFPGSLVTVRIDRVRPQTLYGTIR